MNRTWKCHEAGLGGEGAAQYHTEISNTTSAAACWGSTASAWGWEDQSCKTCSWETELLLLCCKQRQQKVSMETICVLLIWQSWAQTLADVHCRGQASVSMAGGHRPLHSSLLAAHPGGIAAKSILYMAGVQDKLFKCYLRHFVLF